MKITICDDGIIGEITTEEELELFYDTFIGHDNTDPDDDEDDGDDYMTCMRESLGYNWW